ncbi:MAG: DUF4215 domain-containing protein [Nannocystis sp.]|nr:DUF4215 domain-containing protein [Nannocystis sp.]MBA3545997.1 DUF4215 domain-containing protein [Nannocystis sp.]
MSKPTRICDICTLCCAIMCSIACAIERNDQSITEQGVTYWPSNMGDTSALFDTSTSTGNGTSGAAPGTDQESASGASMAGSEVSGTDAVSSTGAPGPVCGDGVVEGDETCDDGNATPGDGCQECAKDSIVFVTSEVYQGFALGGLYGADQRCQSLAAKADLPRFLTFRAWLSTPTMPAADRLIHSPGRYVLVNGLAVAQNWDALTSGSIKNAIVVDESSQTRESGVWTGTLLNGQPALGSEFCKDWDDDSGLLKFGGTGLSMNTDSAWSFFDQGPCGSELRLYCIEQ